jgi:hypothetical protein
LIVKNIPGIKIFRKVVGLGSLQNVESKELIIRQNNGDYTEEFKVLMNPYYLKI